MTKASLRGKTALFPWLAAAVLAMLAPAAGASTICRWVDESGRTQLSDDVPERYKGTATCTDSQKYDASPVQRQAVPQRAQGSSPADVSPAQGAASRTGAKRPAEGVTDSTDCQTWWRRYEEAEACFGPFRTARGGIKAEAFQACTAVPNPESKCSAQKN